MISCPSCGSNQRTETTNVSWPFPVSICNFCKITYQHGAPSVRELETLYKDSYIQEQYTHTMKQDKETAKKRLKHYNFKSGTRVLDVGAGIGAFVHEARKLGIDAWGAEPSTAVNNKYIYNGYLDEIGFPTQSFDVITLHDVVEHCPDITALLKECERIVVDGGLIYVEIPNVWNQAGHKHRKPEHLWFPMEEDAIRYIEHISGFKLHKRYFPIKGKMLLSFTIKKAEPVSILVPPGIGDAYWSMVKLPGFLKEKGIVNPHVYISSPNNGRDRCHAFLNRIPIAYAAGYKKHSTKSPEFQEAYVADGRTVFEDVAECDYFFAYNGIMRFGKSIDAVDPQYPAEWFPRIFINKKEQEYQQKLQKKYGSYLVGYFVNAGMYSHWLEEFPVEQIHKTNVLLCKKRGCKMLLIGAKWDKEGVNDQLKKLDKEDIYVDLTGKTDLDQCFGLLRGAAGVVGFPSGITIVSTVFKVPTLMLWNQYFHTGFWHNAVPPQALFNWYQMVDTATTSPEEILDRLESIRIPLEDDKRTGLYWNVHTRAPKRKEDPFSKVDPKLQKQIKKNNPSLVRHYKDIKGKPRRKSGPTGRDVAKQIIVATVLRSGGDFNESHAIRFHNNVRRLMENVEIRCLTDSSYTAEKLGCDVVVPLERKDWRGWWSKIELFRRDVGLCKNDVRAIYFDLDTILVDTVDELTTSPLKFAMLHGFKHPERKASGIMAWQGDYSKIYKRLASQLPPSTKQWDQVFIADSLEKDYHKPQVIQDILRVASFKNDCNGTRPKNTQVICFHGTPRPWHATEDWVVKELQKDA